MSLFLLILVTLQRIHYQSVCRHNVNLEVHSILCPTLWNFDNFTNQWRGQVEKVLPWIRIIVTRYTFKVRLYLSWFVIGQSKASQVSRIWWGLTSFCINKEWWMIMRITKIIACCILHWHVWMSMYMVTELESIKFVVTFLLWETLSLFTLLIVTTKEIYYKPILVSIILKA